MGFLDVIKDATKSLFLDFAEIAMKDFLHGVFRKTAIKEFVKLCLVIGAVTVAIFKPLGNVPSLWVSSIVFIGLLFLSVFNFLRSVGDVLLFVLKVIQEWSLSLGIKEFIRWRWFGGWLGFAVYDITQAVWLNKLPRSGEVVKTFLGFVIKDIVLFAAIFALYIISVHFIFKPIILSRYAGVTTLQLYLFPLVQLLNVIKR